MKKALLSKAIPWLASSFAMLVSHQSGAVALQIEDYRAAQSLTCVALPTPTFSLSFIHSVSLTPVTDRYRIEQDSAGYRIVQTAEHFIAHGQGLPSMLGEPDAIAFEHKEGEFVLHMERPIPDLLVRTDARFKNRLHTDNTTINLNQWSDNGLRIRPVSHCNTEQKL
ncbi:DUF1850 domain-containing protein [Neptunomonas sp. XY-337]|uniref:DUF1850 domain-containing protein n=1 Tax=Neptunomonas sp. XY-337 TaxID=2561897 RepID=UPI0010AA55BA|nr:DUF1850 domain-containing protein [Neptunomonas sp. XY-337]